MVEVRTYQIKPTDLIPNSPWVLIHYPGLLLEATKGREFNAAVVADIFGKNGWHTQWVARYGPTQGSHYHSAAHECMAVISGEGATIRFGAADTNDDMEENTHGSGFEDNGTYVKAGMGDVFIIPAGVAHKTFDPLPKVLEDTEHMAPGAGHLTAEPEEARKALAAIHLDGRFMMVGAYPYGGEWDWSVGGDHKGLYEKVWSVPRPDKDPVLGTSLEGLVGLWKQKQPRSRL